MDPSPATPPAPTKPTLAGKRTSSITSSIINARPYPGVLAATGHAIGSSPSLQELRRNSAASTSPGPAGRRRSSWSALTDSGLMAAPTHEHGAGDSSTAAPAPDGAADTADDAKPGAWAATAAGLAAFWRWFLTPLGFAITIYMLNGACPPPAPRSPCAADGPRV